MHSADTKKKKKNRGCIDHLTNLESYIREAFIRREHVTSLF